MQENNLKTISNESSSKKIFLVKKQMIKNSVQRDAKSFFTKSPYESNLIDTSQLLLNQSTLKSKQMNRLISYQSLHTDNSQNQQSLINLIDSRIQKKSQIIFNTLNASKASILNKQLLKNGTNTANSSVELNEQNKNPKTKYLFETIVDKSFNKSLIRKQISILQNPQQQTLNNQSKLSAVGKSNYYLPKIQKKFQNNYANFITSNSLASINKMSQLKVDQINLQSSIIKNVSPHQTMHKDSPFYKVRSELVDKFNIQKLKNYQKMWQKKQTKRVQQTKKGFLSFNKSVITKSTIKSGNISRKSNDYIIVRKSLQKFEDNLRDRKKCYATIGQPYQQIKGLQGKHQNKIKSMQSIYEVENRNFRCQQVYKRDTSHLRKRNNFQSIQ